MRRSIVLCALLAALGCRGSEETSSFRDIPKLTTERLSAIPDSEVEFAIVEYVGTVIGDDWENEVSIVQSLPPGVRLVYSTWLVEAEVNNGGFNQYFWNSSGLHANDALSGLRLLGATAHADLLAKAIEVHKSEESNMRGFRTKGTIEAFSASYQETQLNALDEQYLALTIDLSKLRIAYIRKNPGDFAQ